jgi:predicted Fe-Mo cluster-binding NifX family protein
MKLAIPVLDSLLYPHFGRCSELAIVEVDMTSKAILSKQILAAPKHEPGKLPQWLKSHGVNVVITGGIGARAAELCDMNQIQVLTGAPAEPVDAVVTAWLQGHLKSGSNTCDHDSQEHHKCGEHHGQNDGHSCGGHHA